MAWSDDDSNLLASGVIKSLLQVLREIAAVLLSSGCYQDPATSVSAIDGMVG